MDPRNALVLPAGPGPLPLPAIATVRGMIR